MTHKLEHGFDALVLGALPIGVLTQILPPLAALVSVIYGCIKIYETKTFQKFLSRFMRKEK
jgi:hypothetical protein